jgi:hypothetical protein
LEQRQFGRPQLTHCGQTTPGSILCNVFAFLVCKGDPPGLNAFTNLDEMPDDEPLFVSQNHGSKHLSWFLSGDEVSEVCVRSFFVAEGSLGRLGSLFQAKNNRVGNNGLKNTAVSSQ